LIDSFDNVHVCPSSYTQCSVVLQLCKLHTVTLALNYIQRWLSHLCRDAIRLNSLIFRHSEHTRLDLSVCRPASETQMLQRTWFQSNEARITVHGCWRWLALPVYKTLLARRGHHPAGTHRR